MSALAVEFNEQQELLDAPEELRLSESAGVVDASVREGILERAKQQGIELRDGEELLQIIRPCVGGGRGTRRYYPDVLEADAPNWKGARMFRNHLTEAERKKLEGLPRPIEHLAGRIRESWWDGETPPDDKYEKGGVYAIIRPTRFIRELLDDDPGLIEASISALATGIRPAMEKGRQVTAVEGIRLKPRSVDWVTEGGAGGRVLREAVQGEEEEAVLESMTDDEIRAYLEQERPGLLDVIEASSSKDDPDGDDDVDSAELTRRAMKHMRAGKPRKEAMRLAREEMAATQNETEEGAVMAEGDGITPEALAEALATDEGKQVIATFVNEALEGYEPEGFVRAEEVERLVESKLAERADLIRIETRGELERSIELRDMRDKAVELVEGAKLHPRLADRIKSQFSLSESGEPTAELNIAAEIDADGNVVRRPVELLVEAVEVEIEAARKLQSELRPTRVRGHGREPRLVEAAVKTTEDGKAKVEPAAKKTTGSSLTDELLESAGFAKDELGALWNGQ